MAAFSVDAEGPDPKTVTDYSKFTFVAGEQKSPATTGGGDYNPFWLRIDGNAESLKELLEVHLNGRPYHPLSFKGKWYLASAGRAVPTAFIAIAFPEKKLGSALLPRKGDWDFTPGFGGGLLKTAVPVLDGQAIVSTAVWPSLQAESSLPVAWVVQTSSRRTVIERSGRFAASWRTISRLSAIVQQILDDDSKVVYPVIWGDLPELGRLSVEFNDAFSADLEIMQEVYQDAGDLTRNEVGRLMGFAIHEAIRYISTKGPAGLLKHEIMKDVLTNLKDHPSYST